MARLERYKEFLRKRGWNVDRWEAALKDTLECRDKAIKEPDSITRMEVFFTCRTGRRLPAKA